MDKIKIFIVDDHSIVRDGIKMMLSFDSQIEIIGEFESSESLFIALKKSSPDIILLDITMPGLNGIEITKILRETYPDVKVLILSSLNDNESITESIKAGAHGFLSKDTRKEELKKALITVSENKRYVGSDLVLTVFDGYVNGIKKSTIQESDSVLTNREIEIVKLFSDGFLYKEIADKLDISIKTVESHKSNIMKKLEIKSTAELVKYAIKNGIVDI